MKRAAVSTGEHENQRCFSGLVKQWITTAFFPLKHVVSVSQDTITQLIFQLLSNECFSYTFNVFVQYILAWHYFSDVDLTAKSLLNYQHTYIFCLIWKKIWLKHFNNFDISFLNIWVHIWIHLQIFKCIVLQN